ncbi:MAG: ATP-grasp domain-containing protein, partial [Bacteroidota bacterium]|nr:ATP-grasp domain-containing protein [Bacteroidota bacterium]
YLVMDKIIQVCKDLNVDAIHPGYGFLSENAKFAKRVEEEGITFIGPGPEAIRVMGDKLMAKETVSAYDIPLVPGSPGAIEDVEEAKKIAADIGFPVLIKASAGGGGKGMRLVDRVEDFESQMKLAISEATSAFGDGSVFIEKFVTNPRHIEIQVLADKHGNVVHLFERECSVQRRHQKVIEEAPSGILTPETRKRMGEAAVNVAKSCNYVGAGTVEFIYGGDGDFYFLEMNTRLQVEHPVTEMITGVDLVKEMILIAEGHPLSFAQEDLSINGHSIEVRVYAENPANNFLPDIGRLNVYRRPQGPGVRVDDGFEEGLEVPIFYDPMIAKLSTHGATRIEAIDRMIRAIEEYEVGGVETTLGFGKFVMEHEAFRTADFDTNFVSKYFTPDALVQPNEDREEVAVLLAAYLMSGKKESTKTSASNGVSAKSKWKINRKA